MTRHLRDILFLLVAAIVIITLFWATTEQDEYVIKVPKYFRGQLVADTRFVGPQNERQRAVVAAFEHAWTGYRQFAWGHDNLKPNTKRASDWFGLGLTIVDSLSTMIIMNLKDHVEEARNWVETSFRTDVDEKVSLFEVSIRVLGGLLSAHYLSGDKVYLTKANEMGARLLPCFTSSQSGIPYPWINLESLEVVNHDFESITSIAEAGSVEMEFRALAESTKNKEYEKVANKANAALHNLPKIDGLVYSDVYINKAMFAHSFESTLSAGGRVDSYYEYLLKQWIQIGKPRNHPLIEDYKNAVDGMMKHLVRPTEDNKHIIIGQSTDGEFSARVEHLACFLPGTLLLGHKNGMPESHLKLATDLLESCHATYTHTPTHLAPEQTTFSEGTISSNYGMTYSLLRPEFVESLYYFWAITGNSTYQEWGWDIFMAIEKYAKVENGGYTSLQNIDLKKPRAMDNMESFFLAETLKYLYLLFSDDRNVIDLNQFVFNTEAHPLPILS